MFRWQIVCLLICVAKFNAQDYDELPTPTKEYISRGNDAAPGQFPYQVGLHGRRGHFCGASLIGARWVLSAAHCFFQRPTSDPSIVKVYVGSTNINSGDIYDVRSIQMHPGYQGARGYQFDAAVLQTFIRIELNYYIQPIALAFRGVSRGRECIVSGWGLLGYQGSSSRPETLQYVVETVIGWPQCKNAWPVAVGDSNMCTQRVGESGPRPGDSGGPLVFVTPNGYRQVGIVSGSAPGRPYVYTSVKHVRDWIERATNFELI
ncbi:hypothetical protein HA402_004014 [Bradysia odoriphaga]|nr:hypothetical protein HA402_004014 [Bradysia odoriphaga]